MTTTPGAWIRRAFPLYALGLFTGTHWPKLQIHGPIPRTDLVLHVSCFFGWAFLLTLCGFFGPRWSHRNIARVVGLGILYSALDEGLQAIPALHRSCDWSDFLADCSGILLAGIVALTIGLATRPRPSP